MRTKDSGRKWMWGFLGAVLAFQVYFVRELLAAFALFVLGFAFIGGLTIGFFLLQRVWEAGLARVQQRSGPVVGLARRGLTLVEDMAKRPFTRPGSEPVQ